MCSAQDVLLRALSGTIKNQGGGKSIRVTITGTYHENVTMTIGERTETITTLPYEFYISKNLLPQTATFTSPNYEYSDITVNRKAEDSTIGHYYVLHCEKKTNNLQATVIQQTPQPQTQAQATAQPGEPKHQGLNMDIDVNQAPETHKTSENTFAIIIANEHYDMAKNVDMAQNDGLAFKEYCSKTLGLGEHNIKFYPDATYGKINKALNDVKSIASAFDGDINLIFYYSGHGIPDNATQDAYLMPVDADGTDQSVCLSLKKLYQTIDDMKLNQTVVFLDACFSGARRDGDMIVAARGVAIKPKEEKPHGTTIIFTAASDEEAAYAYKEKEHGMFSYFLLNKLKQTNGTASLGELANYITTQVKRQSIVVNGKSQTPTVLIPENMQDVWTTLTLSGN